MTKRKMKKVRKNQKKDKKNIIIIALLLLLMVSGLGYKVLNSSKNQTVIGGNFLPEGKDAKKMSQEELEKAAQKEIDMSKFTLNIYPEATFPDSKSEGKLYIKNEATNAYPISVEIIDDETGDTLYESGAINPGYEITNGTLEKELEKGAYTCTAKVSIYDPKTKEYKGQTAAEMLLEVQG
ncbi:hypothetical protein ACQUEF_04710 [Vagococcus fluvialis]|uniref:hypothetical protein n=1 Tax=Vagococcus fluvialis TaxID=2738 RepID=UPI003D0C11ED